MLQFAMKFVRITYENAFNNIFTEKIHKYVYICTVNEQIRRQKIILKREKESAEVTSPAKYTNKTIINELIFSIEQPAPPRDTLCECI